MNKIELDNVKIYKDDVLNRLPILSDKIGLVITDPPYFVIPQGKGKDKFDWDKFNNLEQFIQFTQSWFNLLYDKLENNSFMFIFWSQKYINEGIDIFKPNRILIWHYKNLLNTPNGDFTYDYEPIFVIKKGSPKLTKGKHSCILEYTKPQSNFVVDKAIYPTQKPYKLIEDLLDIIDLDKNNYILDCFMGSGVVYDACISKGLKFIGIDKATRSFDIVNKKITVKN